MAMSPRLLRPRATSAYDADAQVYFNAVAIADGQQLEPAVKKAINDFVKGCKADGIWSAIKASCILMGARTLSGALTPLVGAAPTNVNFVSGNYDRKTGLLGDASTKYLDTGRNNNADPQNNKHAAVYVSVAGLTTQFLIATGANATGDTSITTQRTFRCNCANPSGTSRTVATGLYGVTRSLSASFVARSAGENETFTVTSETPRNQNLWVFGSSTAGQLLPSSARLSFYSIGEALTLSSLDSRVSTLYTAIGAAVGPNYADADVNAYINAVETADGQLLETGVRDAINTFITGCKADGIWSAIKASCILMGARTLSGALTPLVGAAPTNNGPFVSGDYNRKTGLVGNGTSKYLDTGYAFSSGNQNNRHAAVYVQALQSSGSHAYFGSALATLTATPRSQLVAASGAEANLISRLSDETSSTSATANNVAGFQGISRTASASYTRRAAGSDQTISVTSLSGADANLWVFARNTTTPSSPLYTTARLAYYSAGENVNLSLLDSRVATLFTAIGAAIP